jgi:predicted transcriptional regulator
MKRKVTLTLDDETAAMIKSIAARLGVSKSQVLTNAIRDFGARSTPMESERLRPGKTTAARSRFGNSGR